MYSKVLFATMSLAVATFAAAPAAAVNPGFELGDTTGWASSDPTLTGASTALGSFTAYEGTYFGYATGGAQDVFTTLSQTFVLTAGQTLKGVVGFRANDVYQDSGTIYNDSAYLTINGDTVFSSDVLTVGDFQSSPWTPFSITSLTGGTFTLELGSANHGDGEPSFSSSAVLDAVEITSAASGTPEPAAWALMLTGFGAVGLSVRRRRTPAFA